MSQVYTCTPARARDIATYALRLVVCLVVFELLASYLPTMALGRDQRILSQYTPFEAGATSYFMLKITWLKFLLIWRMFRLWAMLDGVDVVSLRYLAPGSAGCSLCLTLDGVGFAGREHEPMHVEQLFVGGLLAGMAPLVQPVACAVHLRPHWRPQRQCGAHGVQHLRGVHLRRRVARDQPEAADVGVASGAVLRARAGGGRPLLQEYVLPRALAVAAVASARREAHTPSCAALVAQKAGWRG